jgi:hypothetical protein
VKEGIGGAKRDFLGVTCVQERVTEKRQRKDREETPVGGRVLRMFVECFRSQMRLVPND